MAEYVTAVMSDASTNEPKSRIRMATLISGGGRTVENLHKAIASRALNARIELVISSRPDVAGVERCESLGLPVTVVERKGYNTPAEFSDVVLDRLRQANVDLVCLAGFLSLLVIPPDFEHRVINVHPSLLPSFGGKGMFGHYVHEAVLAHGCKISGCTVHFASAHYDEGPILLQRACPVMEDDTPDTLAARVFEQECIAYPAAIDLIAQRRVHVEGRRARILPPP